MSVLVSSSPAVCAYLTQHYEGLVQSFEQWVLNYTAYPLDLNWSSLPNVQGVASDFRSVLIQILQILKSHQISPQAWKSAVGAQRFLPSRQSFFDLVSKHYEDYERNKKVMDFWDALWQGPSKKLLSHEKDSRHLGNDVFILSHVFTPAERHWMEAFQKQGGEVVSLFSKGLSSSRKRGSSKKIRAVVSKNMTEEVRWIVSDLKKKLKRVEPQEIFIFCQNPAQYKGLFQSLFYEYFGHTNVTLFPWDLDHVVFPNMKVVYLCGLSQAAGADLGLLDEEKQSLNQTFGKTVFKTRADLEEKTREILRWLSDHTKLTICAPQNFEAWVTSFLEDEKINCKEIPSTKKKFWVKNVKKEVLDTLKIKDPERDISLTREIYSVSQLEQYQHCPYGYTLKYILKIRPEEIKQSVLTPREEGELLHAVLYQWYVSKFSVISQEGSVIPRGSGESSLSDILKEVFFRYEKQFQKEILLAERNRIREIIESWISYESAMGHSRESGNPIFEPLFFEWEFGKNTPFKIIFQGKSIQIRGKVDRIDVNVQTKRFRVVDYKTGSTVPSQKEVLAGQRFQLTLYALAVQELLFKDFLPACGDYARLKMPDVKCGFKVENYKDWESLKERTLTTVFDLKQKIEAGLMPATPKDCFLGCEFKTLCEENA